MSDHEENRHATPIRFSPRKIKIQAMIEDMHVPWSLWPFLVRSKSQCPQDLLIEKTGSHNSFCARTFSV